MFLTSAFIGRRFVPEGHFGGVTFRRANVAPTVPELLRSFRTVKEVLRQSAPGDLVEVEKDQLIGYIGPWPTVQIFIPSILRAPTLAISHGP
jgi:hypothetical protein